MARLCAFDTGRRNGIVRGLWLGGIPLSMPKGNQQKDCLDKREFYLGRLIPVEQLVVINVRALSLPIKTSSPMMKAV